MRLAPRRTPGPPARMPRKPTLTTRSRGTPAAAPDRAPQNHRTVDRVTRILEEVVYSPGLTFAELVRALDAPKSSVHGFIRGLLAKGWLHQEQHRFYLGPAVYGLTLASGHIRAGLVTQQDLAALHDETNLPAYLGVQAGDHLIYVAEAGSDAIGRFDAQSNIRRTLSGDGRRQGASGGAPRRGARVLSAAAEQGRSRPGRAVPGGVPGDQEDAESRPTFAARERGSRSRRPSTTPPAKRWRPLRSSVQRSKCNRASRN